MRTVAVDFDGPLHSYTSGWTGYRPEDEPTPGAVEFVQALLARGYRVVVLSSRADCQEGVDAILDWLDRHGFPPEVCTVTNEKVPAIAYIDDRAVPFNPTVGFTFEAALGTVDYLAGVRQ